MTKMKSYIVLLTLTLFVACVTTSAKVATFETERLVIRDITGDLPSKKFEKIVDKVDSTLTKTPLPSANTYVNKSKDLLTGFTYRGLSPHKFTPMPGVHKLLHLISQPGDK